MTESEAIKELETSIDFAKMCIQNCERKNEIQGYEMAIKALEEVQQYRAIGTVEELETASKYLQLVKKHGTVGKAIDACAEYEGIGTVEECREAMKKKSEKPMAELGAFGEPEEKDIDRLKSLHHKILYSKIAEIVTEQEMIAFLRAQYALKKQLSEQDIERGW
nr:MAG TPA: hypothetical protein [Caudoviricetes sp.]